MMKYTQKEKRRHYNAVAKGEKAVKPAAKFSEAEQRAYAKGQADARNESARIFAWKKSTPEQRKAYAEKKRQRRQEYKAQKAEKKAAKKGSEK